MVKCGCVGVLKKAVAAWPVRLGLRAQTQTETRDAASKAESERRTTQLASSQASAITQASTDPRSTYTVA